jgi:hypothetical protein
MRKLAVAFRSFAKASINIKKGKFILYGRQTWFSAYMTVETGVT